MADGRCDGSWAEGAGRRTTWNGDVDQLPEGNGEVTWELLLPGPGSRDGSSIIPRFKNPAKVGFPIGAPKLKNPTSVGGYCSYNPMSYSGRVPNVVLKFDNSTSGWLLSSLKWIFSCAPLIAENLCFIFGGHKAMI